MKYELPIEEIINRLDVSENTDEDIGRIITHMRRTLASYQATGKPLKKDKIEIDTTSIQEALLPPEPPKFRRI